MPNGRPTYRKRAAGIISDRPVQSPALASDSNLIFYHKMKDNMKETAVEELGLKAYWEDTFSLGIG